jgi:hypothetical protein
MSDFPSFVRCSRYAALAGLALVNVFVAPAAAAQAHPPSHGAEFSYMPEPMVFDLVRPLGARRGELEINTLFQQSSQRGAPFKWAPEVEWTFRDGLAIEAELPLENGQVMTYKGALQGTLATHANGRYQHGWQLIGQRVRADRSWSADALYLAGYRLGARTTIFTMSGVRRSAFAGTAVVQAVQNTSIFFQRSPSLIFGVETNWVFGAADRRSRLLMPQVQKSLGGKYLAEFGVGAEERAPGRWGSAFAARFVRQLH